MGFKKILSFVLCCCLLEFTAGAEMEIKLELKKINNTYTTHPLNVIKGLPSKFKTFLLFEGKPAFTNVYYDHKEVNVNEVKVGSSNTGENFTTTVTNKQPGFISVKVDNITLATPKVWKCEIMDNNGTLLSKYIFLIHIRPLQIGVPLFISDNKQIQIQVSDFSIKDFDGFGCFVYKKNSYLNFTYERSKQDKITLNLSTSTLSTTKETCTNNHCSRSVLAKVENDGSYIDYIETIYNIVTASLDDRIVVRIYLTMSQDATYDKDNASLNQKWCRRDLDHSNSANSNRESKTTSKNHRIGTKPQNSIIPTNPQTQTLSTTKPYYNQNGHSQHYPTPPSSNTTKKQQSYNKYNLRTTSTLATPTKPKEAIKKTTQTPQTKNFTDTLDIDNTSEFPYVTADLPAKQQKLLAIDPKNTNSITPAHNPIRDEKAIDPKMIWLGAGILALILVIIILYIIRMKKYSNRKKTQLLINSDRSESQGNDEPVRENAPENIYFDPSANTAQYINNGNDVYARPIPKSERQGENYEYENNSLYRKEDVYSEANYGTIRSQSTSSIKNNEYTYVYARSVPFAALPENNCTKNYEYATINKRDKANYTNVTEIPKTDYSNINVIDENIIRNDNYVNNTINNTSTNNNASDPNSDSNTTYNYVNIGDRYVNPSELKH